MRHLDLFSGIGGFSLAAEWAGFETAMFCEIDPFCRQVLGKHWPHVPIHDDIRTLTGELVGDVELITGGFPCQPFSVAGKRRGAADDRHLWPEMARVIGECRPRWVLGENVVGFVHMGLDDCLADLESLGYEAWPVVVPACAIGAWHPRARVWIVAHAHADRESKPARACDADQVRGQLGNRVDTDPAGARVRRRRPSGQTGLSAQLHQIGISGWWESESRVRGIPDGVSAGVDGREDRLVALGNAIVPQVAYVILSAMLEAA